MLNLPFGRYVLLERLAVGGMAEVFLAQPGGQPSQRVVLKQILPQLAEDPELVLLFQDEARIVSHLDHPGVVRTLEAGQHEGIFYLVMEYVDGLDLARVFRFAGAEPWLSVALSIRVGLDLLRALSYVHRATDPTGQALRIIHRDVTPANVLVSRRGEVKLTDFGIARASIRERRTATGVVRGKVAYLAPEQLRGEGVDERVDLHAVGVILFESIAGRRPFLGDDPTLLRQLLEEEPPALSTVVPSIDPRIDEIVARALARRPEDRFRSAEEMANALNALDLAATQEALGETVVRALESRAKSLPRSKATVPDRTQTLATTVPQVSSERAAPEKRPEASSQVHHGQTLPPRRTSQAYRDAKDLILELTMLPRLGRRPMWVGRLIGFLLSALVVSSISWALYARWQRAAALPSAVDDTGVGVREKGALPPLRPENKDVKGVKGPRGTLSLSAVPSAHVEIDGRIVGQTPLSKLELPVGAHRVVLRNSERGVSKSLVVRIEPGRDTTLQVVLSR